MSTTIKRHPDAATLLSFAAGSLPEALAAVVAAHVCLCSRCRPEVHDMERIGAALIATSRAGGGDLMGNLPALPPERAAVPAGRPSPIWADKLPAPIARAYGLGFDTIAWKWLGPGVWHHRLELSPHVVGDLRLLKIAAGCNMPEHGHGGAELTLVLDGAYGDETGDFRRGDVQDVDGEIEHRPIADRELGCICLIASERPARFKGLVVRLMQPWTGM